MKQSFLIAGGVFILTVAAVSAFLFLATRPSTPSPKPLNIPRPVETQVTLTDHGFVPKNVTIKAGQAVRWANHSSLQRASVNSDDHPTNRKYKPLNLGVFGKNSTLMLTFDKPGSYGYHNYFKPEQRGTVTVTE